MGPQPHSGENRRASGLRVQLGTVGGFGISAMAQQGAAPQAAQPADDALVGILALRAKTPLGWPAGSRIRGAPCPKKPRWGLGLFIAGGAFDATSITDRGSGHFL